MPSAIDREIFCSWDLLAPPIWFRFSFAWENWGSDRPNYLPRIIQQMFLSVAENAKGDLERGSPLSLLYPTSGSGIHTGNIMGRGGKKNQTRESRAFQSFCLLSPSIWSTASSSTAGMCSHRKLLLPYLPSEKICCFWKDIFVPQTLCLCTWL